MGDVQEFGRSVLDQEAEGIRQCAELLDDSFENVARKVLNCQGFVVVCGVGKPWLIAQKISATLASTGTRSFPLHPSEALHGDLGRLSSRDIVLMLSNSGTSDEVLNVLGPLKRIGCEVIGVTSQLESPLAQASDDVLNMGEVPEACPIGMAPSVSTTTMLALGDALALTVMKLRSFGREDYARYHPGGALGRSMMTVSEVMQRLENTAVVPNSSLVKDALNTITEKKTGTVFVTDQGELLGVFTDGDLRRHIEDDNLLVQPIQEVMTLQPINCQPTDLASEALYLMQEKRVGEIAVVDVENQLCGHVALKDLVAMRFM